MEKRLENMTQKQNESEVSLLQFCAIFAVFTKLLDYLVAQRKLLTQIDK